MEDPQINDFLRISDLINGYLKGELHRPEVDELFAWVDANEANQDIFEKILNEQDLKSLKTEFKAFDTRQALKNVSSQLELDLSDHQRSYQWLLQIAATVLLCLSIGTYLFIKHNTQEQMALKAQDIAPGKNQATLTLANGQKIILTKGMKGQLAQGITVDSNEIAYQAAEKLEYNTLSTKKGEQSPYPLILADGTKVWLDAASSITFPTSFTGKYRIVTITGEAYLEVVHHKAHPFNVKVKGQVIEDIGTSFNINAYDDEPIAKTTLIAGRVSIVKDSQQLFLDPGQQAQTDRSGAIKVTGDADIEEVLAWKNGLFKFDHANLKSVMRQLSRWYNVEVAYEGAIPEDGISGKLYKNVSAANALEILNSLKINFRIENAHGIKKIIITP